MIWRLQASLHNVIHVSMYVFTKYDTVSMRPQKISTTRCDVRYICWKGRWQYSLQTYWEKTISVFKVNLRRIFTRHFLATTTFISTLPTWTSKQPSLSTVSSHRTRSLPSQSTYIFKSTSHNHYTSLQHCNSPSTSSFRRWVRIFCWCQGPFFVLQPNGLHVYGRW